MQDTRDLYAVRRDAVEKQVRADRKGANARRQLVAVTSDMGAVCQHLRHIFETVH